MDTVSHTEEEYNRLADRDIQLVLNGLELAAQSAVLEIGCGVGRLLCRIAARGSISKIIGIDIAENMIQFAEPHCPVSPDVELHVNSGADLSMIQSSSVDFAYSNDVFIHIADSAVVRTYLLEIRRVLETEW